MSAIRRVLTVVFCTFFLAACQEDTADVPASQSEFPDLMAEQRLSCERAGGRWGPTASKTGFVCFQTMSDANQSCSGATDCEGLCLARSRTCSPVKPFFGCHEVLSPTGLPQTLCIE